MKEEEEQERERKIDKDVERGRKSARTKGRFHWIDTRDRRTKEE